MAAQGVNSSTQLQQQEQAAPQVQGGEQQPQQPQPGGEGEAGAPTPASTSISAPEEAEDEGEDPNLPPMLDPNNVRSNLTPPLLKDLKKIWALKCTCEELVAWIQSREASIIAETSSSAFFVSFRPPLRALRLLLLARPAPPLALARTHACTKTDLSPSHPPSPPSSHPHRVNFSLAVTAPPASPAWW